MHLYQVPTSKIPVFIPSVITLVILSICGGYLAFRGTKGKSEFHRADGRIIYIAQTYNRYPVRNAGKYRYIAIDNYPAIFEVFIGHDAGDFSPKLEQMDALKQGDQVSIYFDEQHDNYDKELNRLLQYLDKDGKPYFVKGNEDMYGGLFIITFCTATIMLLVYLKQKKYML